MPLRTVVAVIGIGGWYPRGVARVLQTFDAVCPGIEVRAWVNTWPIGAPSGMVVDGYDYSPYAAKPFALKSLLQSEPKVDIGILIDAAFFPIRHINPLISHIADNGFYFCKNGFRVGQWASDDALHWTNLKRSTAYEIEEVSSYCVGVDLRRRDGATLVREWANLSTNPHIIAGPHTAAGFNGRNRGFVSLDPNVQGHRHDQTALSILRYGMRLPDSLLVERPRFTAYLGHETEETVLVNQGGI